MTETPTQHYSQGDTIRINMQFRDKTGVGEAIAMCPNTEEGSNATIDLRGNGQGETSAVVTLEAQVTEETAPGEYRCQYIQVHDTEDNYAIHHPDPEIRFIVDQKTGDFNGPEFLGWSLG